MLSQNIIIILLFYILYLISKQNKQSVIIKEKPVIIKEKQKLISDDRDSNPPFRTNPYFRDDYIQPTSRHNIKNYINIPTRGYPDYFRLMGILTRDADEKVLQLFGRQIYPGASTYEYYVAGRDSSGMGAKIPLDIPGDKELYNNDLIDIPQYNNQLGQFKVMIYDYDKPRYNPYVL